MPPVQLTKLNAGGKMLLHVLGLTTSALLNMQSLHPTARAQEEWLVQQSMSSPQGSNTSLDTEKQPTIQRGGTSS